MTPGIIKKLYHTTPVGLTDENKQEVYPITATSAVYSAPGESSFPNMSLDNILDALNQGYHYMGKASPTTNPGVFNHKVFYLASEAGTYSHFDGITVSGLTVLKTDGNGWSADAFNITGGGGGGGLTTAYIGTTMVQETPAPQQLSGISQLNLTSGARIYFGETAYIELDQYGFHFSEGIYSDSFVAAGGIGSGGGGGGGGGAEYLRELTDVYHSSSGVLRANGSPAQDGDSLVYNSGTSRWVAAEVSGGIATIPAATSSALGGIKLGYTQNAKNYPVELDGDNKAFVSVPWEGGSGGGGGTVTSITLNSGTGITVSSSGTAITTSGSRTISIASSYRTKIDHGDTAYGWGNHASAGYADAATVNTALAGKQDTISDIATIRANASRGNTAYGWGNHANAGYAMATDLASLTNRVTAIEAWFEVVDVSRTSTPEYALHAKNGYAIYSDSWIAAGGINSESGGGGGGSGSSVEVSGLKTTGSTIATLTVDSVAYNIKDGITWGSYNDTAKTVALTLDGQQYVLCVNGYAAGGGGGGISVETDPVFTAHPAYGITTNKISEWDAKSTFSGDYYDLTNRPTFFGITFSGGTFSPSSYMPTTSAVTVNIPTTLDNIADGSNRKLTDYVTLSTTQTITGAKTFTTNPVTIGSSSSLSVDVSSFIDIGPVRIKFENNAIHITKKDTNDTNTYGLYADGFLAAGGLTS